MSLQRARLACTACTRRKVKCSKTVPCTNCVRRGENGTCSSDVTTPNRPTPQPVDSMDSPLTVLTAEQQEVERLRSRILELENHLHERDPSAFQSREDIGPSQSNSGEMGAVAESYAYRETPIPGRDEEEGQQADAADSATKDAASILEFLAWGRRKNIDYNSVISPEASADVGPSSVDVGDTLAASSFSAINDNDVQLALLQLLLPGKRQVYELVRYHEECLLWYHCSFFAPRFRSQVDVFYSRFRGDIQSPGLNLQWLALFFSIITGSLTCASIQQTRAWGFRPPERETLCKKWFRAVYTCLNAAEYAANQSILSVQAISTLTISAHILGFSNMHSIHLAAGIRVAQGLGLHRITDEFPGSVVDKECGRRLWSHLCCQDWFSIPFSDTYLINPYYSTSDQPMNCHDKDMVPLSESEPTITTYCRLLTRIASIMPQLQDDLTACNTPFTRYEQVHKWDKQMRMLSAERPSFLKNTPIDASWPCYITWARRSLAITSAHKIIMIHRSFLSDSFTNPAFSFTRRTCLAASKTIIKEYRLAIDDNEPTLWIHQAFSVAASIILILDVLHRNPVDSECVEHRQLAEDIVGILQQCENSMIATRGVELLSALLGEIPPSSHISNTRKHRHDGFHPHADANGDVARSGRQFSVSSFVKTFCNGKKQGSTAAFPDVSHNYTGYLPTPEHPDVAIMVPEMDPTMADPPDLRSGHHPADDILYFPQALEASTGFENLLYLASHDFSANHP